MWKLWKSSENPLAGLHKLSGDFDPFGETECGKAQNIENPFAISI